MWVPWRGPASCGAAKTWYAVRGGVLRRSHRAVSDNGPMASPRSGRPPRGHSSAGDSPSRRTSARAERRAGRGSTHLETASGGGGEDDAPESETTGPVVRSGVRVTRRFTAVVVVVAILVISLVSSLRVYLNQRAEMAQARNQINQSSQQIATLEQDKQQWNDPDYVRAQARTRLGWVMPGETGYRVVDASGQPYSGGSTIDRTGASTTASESWWQRLWGSAQAADQPTPTPSAEPSNRVIAVSPSPSASATP